MTNAAMVLASKGLHYDPKNLNEWYVPLRVPEWYSNAAVMRDDVDNIGWSPMVGMLVDMASIGQQLINLARPNMLVIR